MRHLLTIDGARLRFYNRALRKLKLPTAAVKTLQVDRMGWSPELAETLAKRGIPTDYLRVGGVQYAIVVSPLQAKAPVLMPAHSFDELCIDRLFAEAASQVPNLTERAAVLVTMARNIDEADCARDLQHVEHVSIEASDVAGVMLEARFQREFAANVRRDDVTVFDEGLRAKAVQSALRFGDLRHEALDISKLTFGDVRCFYTAGVAGGTWIFRDLPGNRVLTVVRECEHGEKASSQYVVLGSPEERQQVLLRLLKAKLLCETPESHAAAADRARQVRLAILAATARDVNPDAKLAGMDDIERRRLAKSLSDRLPGAYRALDRFATLIVGDRKERDEADRIVREEGLLPWLAVPDSGVTPGMAAALSSLLAAIAPEDVLRLRKFDRLSYRRARHGWPTRYVEWVDEQISLAEKPAGE